MGDSALGNPAGVVQPAVSLAQETIRIGVGGVITNDMIGNAQQVVTASGDQAQGTEGVGSGSLREPSSHAGEAVDGTSNAGQDAGLL
ncbi:hypothetical protein ACFWAT_01655 [Streptomyces syringium]|uniref:hypothetical protein n=1 Tax=Streptomyces syringium TaxID=76729 RepID=UPI00364C69F3